MENFILSFTGVDDHTDLSALYRLAHNAARDHKLLVEAGVLIFPEKTGIGRNPSYNTRMTVTRTMRAAAHLCGVDYYRSILTVKPDALSTTMSGLSSELDAYPRIQLNINARRDDFTEEEVHDVYCKMLANFESSIILQYHERSADCIHRFLEKLEAGTLKTDLMSALLGNTGDWKNRVQILVDGSQGTGKSPESWKIKELDRLKPYAVGMAGGITPENFTEEFKRFIADNGGCPSWVDGESGYRDFHDENDRVGKFSIAKCGAAIRNAFATTQAS